MYFLYLCNFQSALVCKTMWWRIANISRSAEFVCFGAALLKVKLHQYYCAKLKTL